MLNIFRKRNREPTPTNSIGLIRSRTGDNFNGLNSSSKYICTAPRYSSSEF